MGEARRRQVVGAGATFAQVGRDHGVTHLTSTLLPLIDDFARMTGVSQFDVLVAFANVSGHHLAAQRDMPRAHAMERIDDLRRVMAAAYDLHDVAGEG